MCWKIVSFLSLYLPPPTPHTCKRLYYRKISPTLFLFFLKKFVFVFIFFILLLLCPQMIFSRMRNKWTILERIRTVFVLTCCLGALPFGKAGTRLEDCDPEMIGFELVTGYVFTAPDDLLDSTPGTLMLTDCLEACQGNDTCQSVNYETGLCVLFSSNADYYPGNYNF